MSKGSQIRERRVRAGIPGGLVCRKAGIVRSRLSDIERGYVTPRADEIQRLTDALEELIAGKSVIEAAAAEIGWPTGGGR
jgi:predicted transcriptional regulator